MYVMRYGVTLPSDDMQIMRGTVSRNGRLLDDRNGLGFKAYLMREREINVGWGVWPSTAAAGIPLAEDLLIHGLKNRP